MVCDKWQALPPLNNGPGLDSCEGCSWVIDSVVTLHGVTTLAPLHHILVLSVLFSAYFSEWIKSYFLCRYFRLNAPSILFLFCTVYQTGVGENVSFGIQRSQRPPKNLDFSKARWVEVYVKSVNCGDQQKCAATKLAAIKSYKWTSYIPSQNLQIAANFDSWWWWWWSNVRNQCCSRFLDSVNLQILTIHLDGKPR